MAKKAKKHEEENSGVAMAEGMTKAQMVREAVAKGIEKPSEGIGFIRENFGVEVSPQMFSMYKSIDRKKSGSSGVVSLKSVPGVNELRRTMDAAKENGGVESYLEKVSSVQEVANKVGGLDNLLQSLRLLQELQG